MNGTGSQYDLRNQVDVGIGPLVNTYKIKEQLASQLKREITNLDRFIEILQGPEKPKLVTNFSPVLPE